MEQSWCIYYADGGVFTNEDGVPFAAPAFGVLAIWQHGHDLLFNKDYYLWHAEKRCWLEVDWVGLIDWLTIAAPVIEAVKVGRVVPRQEFKAVMRRVNSERNS